MFQLTDLIILFGVLILLIWLMSSPFYWMGQGIDWLIPWPIVGNFPEALYKSLFEICITSIKLARSPIVGCHVFLTPCLVLCDAELIRQVSITDADSYMTRGAIFKKDDIFGRSIIMNGGEEWKRTRALMTRYFSPAKIKSMVPIVKNCVDGLVRYLEQKCGKGAINIEDAALKLNTDIVATTSFGLEPDSFTNPNSYLFQLQEEFLCITSQIVTIIALISPKIASIFSLSILRKSSTKKIINTVKQVLDARIRGEGVRSDIIQGLTELYVKDKDCDCKGQLYPDGTNLVHFDLEYVVAQCSALFIAGVDTTTHTLSFFSYEMAMNPDIQNRLRNEINEVISQNDGIIGYEQVNQMTYLEMVIFETLRKYPTIPVIARKCTTRTKIGSLDVKKGTVVIIPIAGIHRLEKYYENPNKFDPERFAPGKTIPVGANIPFGIGPRQCIGKRMAEVELKIMVCSMLMKFEIETCPETPKKFKFNLGLTLAPKGGIPLRFRPIINVH